MDYLYIFAVSITVALSGALMPGPLLTAVIYESARLGPKSGPLMILGHAILEIFMVAFIILGFSKFVHNAFAFRIIAVLGAVILFYFGIRMILSLPRLSLETHNVTAKSANLVFSGITVSIANPYWAIWWLTIGLGLVLAAQKQGLLAVVIFFLGHILADFGWYGAISLSVSKGKRFISQRVYQGIIFFCALALIGFALWFLWRAL